MTIAKIKLMWYNVLNEKNTSKYRNEVITMAKSVQDILALIKEKGIKMVDKAYIGEKELDVNKFEGNKIQYKDLV